MSPIEIETLFKVYTSSCEKISDPGLVRLQQCGLVTPDPSVPPDDGEFYHGFVLTRSGTAMIDALKNLPIPKKKVYWVTKFEQAIDEVEL